MILTPFALSILGKILLGVKGVAVICDLVKVKKKGLLSLKY